MSEGSTTPSLADIQRQWREMAEAAAKPWQEAAKAFAEPWRELAESFGGRPDTSGFPGSAQEAWDRLTTSFSALAEQQQRIAEAVFEAMRAAAEEMQKAMEQAVEQMTSFARNAASGGSAPIETTAAPSTSGSASTGAAPRKATRATKASKATKR
jgi:hypothetical protein